MDDQRRARPDETPPADPGEGVRIIGPDEAAEAMEKFRVNVLLVTDADDRLVGALNANDLMRAKVI